MARRVNLSSTILYNLLILWILNPQNLTNNSFLKEKSSKNSNGFVEIHQDLKQNSLLLTTRKCKWLKHRTLYYRGSTASFNITSSAILGCGDIHPPWTYCRYYKQTEIERPCSEMSEVYKASTAKS